MDKHKNCHVLFTRGRSGWKEKQKSETKLKELSEIERKRERQEILEFQKESAQQYEKINSIMRRIVRYTETV